MVKFSRIFWNSNSKARRTNYLFTNGPPELEFYAEQWNGIQVFVTLEFFIFTSDLEESEWKFSDELGVFFHPLLSLLLRNFTRKKRHFLFSLKLTPELRRIFLLSEGLNSLSFSRRLRSSLLFFQYKFQAVHGFKFGKSFPSICTLFLNFEFPWLESIQLMLLSSFNFLFDFGFGLSL